MVATSQPISQALSLRDQLCRAATTLVASHAARVSVNVADGVFARAYDLRRKPADKVLFSSSVTI